MDFSSAIQLVEKSKHVGLVLPPNPNHDALASAEVLAQFFSARNIYVGIITPLQNTNKSFPTLAALSPLTKEFIISLNTSGAPVSQLRYENTDNHINIILSPSSHSVLQDHIAFREGDTQCDCIITLGVSDIEQIDATRADSDPLLFSKTPIIAMDISPSHKQYGEINLVDPSLASLSELAYGFLAAHANHALGRDSATLLLSGILHRTNGFATLANANTLLSSHELVRLGADYETAHALARTRTPISLMSLMGRTLARSRMDEDKEIVWSLITADDFIATSRTPADAPDILDRIKKEFPEQHAHVLLWQDPITQHIHTRMTADTAILQALSDKTDGEVERAHLQLSTHYHSFPDAEHSISALLGDVL